MFIRERAISRFWQFVPLSRCIIRKVTLWNMTNISHISFMHTWFLQPETFSFLDSHMAIALHALGKLFGAAPCRETPEGHKIMKIIVSGQQTMTWIVGGRFLPVFVGFAPCAFAEALAQAPEAMRKQCMRASYLQVRKKNNLISRLTTRERVRTLACKKLIGSISHISLFIVSKKNWNRNLWYYSAWHGMANAKQLTPRFRKTQNRGSWENTHSVFYSKQKPIVKANTTLIPKICIFIKAMGFNWCNLFSQHTAREKKE